MTDLGFVLNLLYTVWKVGFKCQNMGFKLGGSNYQSESWG